MNLLHVLTAGLPPYGAYGDPVFTPGSGDFEIDQWPADYWSVAKAHFPNEGILGQPDYTGTGWTAEVDFVNWYLNDTMTPQDPVASCTGVKHLSAKPVPVSHGYYSNYYPVVPALLMGESYHIIPGTHSQVRNQLHRRRRFEPVLPRSLNGSEPSRPIQPAGRVDSWSSTFERRDKRNLGS